MTTTQSLALDLGVEIYHPETKARGKVIDSFYVGSQIGSSMKRYPVYVVQIEDHAQTINNSARQWAKLGWKIA